MVEEVMVGNDTPSQYIFPLVLSPLTLPLWQKLLHQPPAPGKAQFLSDWLPLSLSQVEKAWEEIMGPEFVVPAVSLATVIL